jgi:dihydrofolate reductase
MDPTFVESFLKTIDCYVMGSRTYETALNFEAKGFGWAYGDKPTFVLTRRNLPRTRNTVEFPARTQSPEAGVGFNSLRENP